jgi:hypothetical protein
MTEAEARQLLDDLCVKLGFCLSPEDNRRLLDNPPREVLAFTDAVFAAEGLEPTNRRLYREVRDMISEAFRRGESDGAGEM